MSHWFPTVAAQTQPQVRLFCFAHAGGGASGFARWPKRLPARIGVAPCHLPGREERLREPALEHMTELLDALIPELIPLLDRPFALFGHSLGGWIAFAAAQRLRERGGPQPLRLFLSACRAPHLPPRLEQLNSLPEKNLLAEVQRRYGPVPTRLLQDADFMQMFLRVLRSDLQLFESASLRGLAPLCSPISVYGGTDDPVVAPADLEAWAEHTVAPDFESRLFAGGHHYFAGSPAGLLTVIAERLGYPVSSNDEPAACATAAPAALPGC